MSDIPSWAVRGRKVVAIDISPAEGANGMSGLALGFNEVFTLLEVRVRAEGVYCRTRHDQTGAEHTPTEWARLSRFRPLSPEQIVSTPQTVEA